MDQQIDKRLDAVVEDDIRRGFRIVPLPDDVARSLTDERITPPTHIRLSRVNPARRRDIAEQVQTKYHADIRNPNVLSNAQVTKLMADRGEWLPEMQAKMAELQEKTQKKLAALWGDGYTPGATTWGTDLLSAMGKLRVSQVNAKRPEEEITTFMTMLNRWVEYTPDLVSAPVYVAAATEQGLERYSPDRDQSRLFDQVAQVDDVDLINEIEDLKDKQVRLRTLGEERVALAELEVKHAKIFSDTAESRRDHCEEMAQLYFTCERSDAEGVPLGRLSATFDGLWEWPEDVIRWMLYESFFFHNDIPASAKEYLHTFSGFRPAARASSENGPSAGSPAPLSSNPDTVPADTTAAASTASAPPTNSTTAS